jgi:hypothetical protein
LDKRLQVSTKNIQSTQLEGENVQLFKDSKIIVEKYVLHSYFYAIDMDGVDIVLVYPWMHSIGTININVQNQFSKLLCKKKKIALHGISLTKRKGLRGHMTNSLQGN